MRKETLLLVCVVLLLALAGTTSCQRIEKAPGAPVKEGVGPLTVETGIAEDMIPAGYGRLVGVTADPVNQWQAVLWFEQPDQNITAVWVNTGKRRVVASLEIPRR